AASHLSVAAPARCFFFSSRRRHTRSKRDWSSDVCSSDLNEVKTSRNDYDELNEYGQEFYREATARKNIIEQILIDRMGYYPKRVDNKLLDALESKIERNGTS